MKENKNKREDKDIENIVYKCERGNKEDKKDKE